jgi:hypothetical protein
MFGQCDQTAEEWDELQDMGMLGPIILTFITDKQTVMLWMKPAGSERTQWGSLAHKTMNLRVLLTFLTGSATSASDEELIQ